MTSLSSRRPSLLLPWLLIASLGLQGLCLIIVILQGFSIRQLYAKAPPTLVQTTSGQAFKVAPLPANERTTETISVFIASIFSELLNMDGTTVAADGAVMTDPGVDIETPQGSKTVTTASTVASFALSAEFRLDFLRRVAELTPPGVFSGQTEVVMVIDQISTPESIAPGQWKLDVLAHLNVFENGSPRDIIPFHRQIVVEATTAPLVPEGDTPLERTIYNIRQAGLHIIDIRDIEY